MCVATLHFDEDSRMRAEALALNTTVNLIARQSGIHTLQQLRGSHHEMCLHPG